MHEGGRDFARYGWMILSANSILGIFAAVLMTAPSLSMFLSLQFQSSFSILGALGIALVGFNIFALVMVLIPYRRYERWAWYTLCMLPLQWLLQFVFSSDLAYLTLTVLTTVGLILPYKRFFASVGEPARVRCNVG